MNPGWRLSGIDEYQALLYSVLIVGLEILDFGRDTCDLLNKWHKSHLENSNSKIDQIVTHDFGTISCEANASV